MFCENCGKELPNGAAFCENCGSPVNEIQKNYGQARNPNLQSYGQVKSPARNNSGLLIALIILLMVLIAAAAFIIGMNVYDNKEKAASAVTATETVKPTDAPTPTPITVIIDNGAPQQPQQPAVAVPPPQRYEPSDRSSVGVMRYDSDRSYKRMGSIHNTVPTDMQMWYKLRDFIETYDSACEGYMNSGSREIFSYLRSGTTAYNQQTQYKSKHPNLTQYYTDIQVFDSRVGGGFYYVWVQETLSVTENGNTKTATDNWVYKIGEDSNGFYVNDYTRDPAV